MIEFIMKFFTEADYFSEYAFPVFFGIFMLVVLIGACYGLYRAVNGGE